MICSDIDGTLLNKDRSLSVKTIEAIKKIKDSAPVILVSSRMPKSMKLLQETLGITNQPMIAYNGSLILDQDKVLLSRELSTTILLDIIAYCKDTNIHLSLYHKDEWMVPEMDYWAVREENNTQIAPRIQNLETTAEIWSNQQKGCHKIMCMGDEKEIGQLYDTLIKFHSNELNIYRSKTTYIEISDKKQNKASALKLLLAQRFPNLKMSDVVAFGDNYNDLSLLQEVGLGVAVENAKEEVLKVANEITKSNIEDGVAISINHHFR
jgi:hypothetical protein